MVPALERVRSSPGIQGLEFHNLILELKKLQENYIILKISNFIEIILFIKFICALFIDALCVDLLINNKINNRLYFNSLYEDISS